MLGRVAVVLDVAVYRRVDGMIAAYDGVFAGMPDGTALLVDDVAGDDILV